MTYLGIPVIVVESFPESGIALCAWKDGRLWVHWIDQLETN